MHRGLAFLLPPSGPLLPPFLLHSRANVFIFLRLFTQIKTISIIKVRQKVLGQPLRRTHCFSFSCTAGEKVWGLISTCPRRLQALESSERILFTRMEMFSFGMYDQESPLSLSHSGLCSS
ncbi:unnamed protein product [Lepidochelys kempii]